ncbi:MAG: hypothetical protein PUB37_05165 [Firmicutes bacterium]|nr:hypothetical protein [Bacillota bacterium]
MKKENFDDKIGSLIRQSADKITPPPFYSVLEKIARNDSIEDYESAFSAHSDKRNHTALKITGIAAALIGLLAVGGVAVINMNGSMEKSTAADTSYEFSEEHNGVTSSSEEDMVSESDTLDCFSSNTSDYK